MRPKNACRFPMCSSVGLKLAGLWKRIAVAERMWAHSTVRRQPFFDDRSGAKRTEPVALARGQRSPHAPIGRARAGVGNQLPGLERELKIRRRISAPTAQRFVFGRLVESLLNFYDTKVAWVLRHSDGKTTEAYLNLPQDARC